MPVLTLVGKPDCHLCHVMQAVVEAVLPEFDAALVTRDLRDDPELEERWRFDIPVLLLDGAELARHRLGEDDLRRLLADNGVARRP